MLFGEKLKALRISRGLSQEKLAQKLDISMRSVQTYENDGSYPKTAAVYWKIANFFGVTTDYLISEEDNYAMDAQAKGGAASRHDVQELITEVGGLFAGGELSEDDKAKVLNTINEMYWRSRELNKRFAPKKRLSPALA